MKAPQAEAAIDLEAYGRNIEALRRHVGDTQLMTVVKANAYGHGVDRVAPAAREAGVDWLGVATVEEAVALRALGDTGPLLCWLAAPGAPYAEAIAADIELTASSARQLEEIVSAAPPPTHRHRPRVQLKVDTGLSRNGARGEDWSRLVEAAAAAQAAGRAEITGVWSHLACSDEPAHPANDRQEQVFLAALDEVAAAGLEPGLRHLSNSAAALTRESMRFDLVRVGIASYGIQPAPGLEHPVPLTPVMTLRGRLAAVKRVPAGSGVSYGHTYTTGRETTLGLVPLGYGEGVPVGVSNRIGAGYAGERIRQVGRVCMDQLMVDLGDRPAEVGDVITLFGPGGDGEPSVQDWAEACGTIGYEIVTRIGGRVVRTYTGEHA